MKINEVIEEGFWADVAKGAGFKHTAAHLSSNEKLKRQATVEPTATATAAPPAPAANASPTEPTPELAHGVSVVNNDPLILHWKQEDYFIDHNHWAVANKPKLKVSSQIANFLTQQAEIHNEKIGGQNGVQPEANPDATINTKSGLMSKFGNDWWHGAEKITDPVSIQHLDKVLANYRNNPTAPQPTAPQAVAPQVRPMVSPAEKQRIAKLKARAPASPGTKPIFTPVKKPKVQPRTMPVRESNINEDTEEFSGWEEWKQEIAIMSVGFARYKRDKKGDLIARYNGEIIGKWDEEEGTGYVYNDVDTGPTPIVREDAIKLINKYTVMEMAVRRLKKEKLEEAHRYNDAGQREEITSRQAGHSQYLDKAANDVIKRSTESGNYSIRGNIVRANNSGYAKTFNRQEIIAGLKHGSFIPDKELKQMKREGLTDDEIAASAWKITPESNSIFVVSNPEVEYWFYKKDFKGSIKEYENPNISADFNDERYDTITDQDRLEIVNHCLKVNGKPYIVDFPEELLYNIEDGKLVTLFRGHLTNYWSPEEIKGYYA